MNQKQIRERIGKSTKGQTAITFISASAGELDWVLPILDFLKIKGFNIKIIFLTRHALKSVEENRMCNDFISQKNHKIEVLTCGDYFFEKIERIGYLSFRIFFKLKLNKLPVIYQIYSFYDKLLKSLFLRRLPLDILNFEEIFHFSEFFPIS